MGASASELGDGVLTVPLQFRQVGIRQRKDGQVVGFQCSRFWPDISRQTLLFAFTRETNVRIAVLGVLFALSGVCAAANLSSTAQGEIAHLIAYLGKSGCQFNRNGSWYSAKEAVDHLHRKYRYLLEKSLISSTEDFIDKAARESSMSGKPYLVKCDNGAAQESAAWFKRELAAFRKQK